MSPAAAVTGRAPWLLLAICLALGAGFRWYHLDRQSFWYDEMFTRFWATGQSWQDVRSTVPTAELPAAELEGLLALPPGRGPRDVIRSIATDDPQHTPLYYLLAHGWIRLFGDSVWTLRALSVLIGLVTLPCVYWLARELGLGLRVSLVATALSSMSPFFVIYSQEARQYVLWGVEVLVASALLLRALRMGRVRDWLLYGIALVAGLYTHLLFATVIVAHALVVIVARGPTKESTDRSRPTVVPFLVTATLTIVALLPWLFSLLANSERAASRLGWSAGRVSLPYLFAMWGFNYSALFVDANHSLPFVEGRDIGLVLDYAFRGAALVLIGIAVFFVWRRLAGLARWFILALIFVPFLSLAIPDLLLGGIRSGGGHRYLYPSYIGIVLAVACLLGDDSATSIRWMRTRAAALYGVVGCALVSLIVHATALTWWTKPVGYHLPRLAHIVSESTNPLLIAPVSVDLLTISTMLAPTVHVLPVRDVASFMVPDDPEDGLHRQRPQGGPAHSAVFVLGAQKALLARLRADGRFDVVAADGTGQLWELRRRTASRVRTGVPSVAIAARRGIGR